MIQSAITDGDGHASMNYSFPSMNNYNKGKGKNVLEQLEVFLSLAHILLATQHLLAT